MGEYRGKIVDIKPFLYQAEANAARLERTIQRLWIALIIAIFMLVGSNMIWVLYELQYEDVTTTIEAQQDGEGVNIIGGGDVSYGTEGQDNNEKESP